MIIYKIKSYKNSRLKLLHNIVTTNMSDMPRWLQKNKELARGGNPN
jgi:hypothetical protein